MAKRDRIFLLIAGLGGALLVYVLIPKGSSQPPQPPSATSITLSPTAQTVRYAGNIVLTGTVAPAGTYQVTLTLRGYGTEKNFTTTTDIYGNFTFGINFPNDFNPIGFGVYSDNSATVQSVTSNSVSIEYLSE